MNHSSKHVINETYSITASDYICSSNIQSNKFQSRNFIIMNTISFLPCFLINEKDVTIYIFGSIPVIGNCRRIVLSFGSGPPRSSLFRDTFGWFHEVGPYYTLGPPTTNGKIKVFIHRNMGYNS